jgi:hypothetical protein
MPDRFLLGLALGIVASLAAICAALAGPRW